MDVSTCHWAACVLESRSQLKSPCRIGCVRTFFSIMRGSALIVSTIGLRMRGTWLYLEGRARGKGGEERREEKQQSCNGQWDDQTQYESIKTRGTQDQQHSAPSSTQSHLFV